MALFDFLFGRRDRRQDTRVSQPGQPHTGRLLASVEVAPGITLPKALADHWPEIEQTKRTFIEIKAVPAEALTLRQSKFRGLPCIPKGFPYPKDAAGKYLVPLAQINFSECPKLVGFPESGYLQFYVAADDMYGLDFDDQQAQTGFRVLFFEEHEVTDPQMDFAFLEETLQTEYTPVPEPYSLTFAHKEEYVGMQDVQSGYAIGSILAKYPEIEEPLTEALYETFPGSGHKIGGYAYFTQTDPRPDHEGWKDYILLFQLDSDDDILWGDVGVGNFFIHPDDLARRDFSKVVYNWDCH